MPTSNTPLPAQELMRLADAIANRLWDLYRAAQSTDDPA